MPKTQKQTAYFFALITQCDELYTIGEEQDLGQRDPDILPDLEKRFNVTVDWQIASDLISSVKNLKDRLENLVDRKATPVATAFSIGNTTTTITSAGYTAGGIVTTMPTTGATVTSPVQIGQPWQARMANVHAPVAGAANASRAAQRAKGQRDPADVDGMYLLPVTLGQPEMIVKVQYSKGTGHPYAMKLVTTVLGKVTFTYAPGVVKFCTPDKRMTLDQARQLSAQYSACVACGRALTAQQSVDDGIGPICRKKFI